MIWRPTILPGAIGRLRGPRGSGAPSSKGPTHYPSDLPDDDGSTRLVLDVKAASDGERWHAASGRILVYVVGTLAGSECGDPVYAAGMMGAIPGPRNPGESDRRDRSRAEGMRLRMSVKDPGSVWPDPDGSPDLWWRWIGRARARSRAALVAGLAPDVSALGAALLLGRREAVDPDLNDAFARTGTMHLLAISGLHLQVLAYVLFCAFLIVGMPVEAGLPGLLVATLAYAAAGRVLRLGDAVGGDDGPGLLGRVVRSISRWRTGWRWRL